MPNISRPALEQVFAENFRSRGEVGSGVSIWHRGEELVSLAGGSCERDGLRAWTPDTLTLIWSATKGIAAACVVHALQAAGVALHRPVAHVWPAFAAAGKGSITLAQALSHQAGLSALDGSVPLLDHDVCAAALAAQQPLWPPGTAHGYHVRTFGPLLDEILRRVVPGTTLGRYWRAIFGDPFELDVWIGLPDELHARAATTYPARVAAGALPNPDPMYAALAQEGSLTRLSFASPSGLHSVTLMMKPEARRAELPALGGIASARGLAKFYSLLATRDQRAFSGPTLEAMSVALVDGADLVLRTPTAFSTGFMLDPRGADGTKLRALFGPSTRAFGHPGSGGIHAFADPEAALSFAFVTNQMELGVFPNRRALAFVECLYSA